MKRKKIISILLISALALSISGCGNAESKGGESTSQKTAVEVVKEEAFAIIPEEKLVTNYIKTKLSQEDSFEQDSVDFINLYVSDKVDKSLISKYNLEYDPKTVYKLTDLHSKYTELFESGITRLYTLFYQQTYGQDEFVNKKLLKKINGYLSDVWNDEKNNDYILATEFSEKHPKETFQKYLIENKIEVKDITYPTFVTGFNFVPGADVATVKVTIKGIQDKESFEKNLALDFYFAPSDEIKNGVKNDDKLSDKDFEIMAVSTGTVPADKFDTYFKYDISKAKEKFGIN